MSLTWLWKTIINRKRKIYLEPSQKELYTYVEHLFPKMQNYGLQSPFIIIINNLFVVDEAKFLKYVLIVIREREEGREVEK